VIRGSCLCGAVRYEIAGTPVRLTHCHCGQCRKGHGAAFATYARIAAGDLRWVAGEGQVRRYRSSPPVERSFCGICGSNLTFVSDEMPGVAWVAAGGFDDDPGVRPSRHIYVDSKAPWFDLSDGLPKFGEIELD
jgi:hypothetical protein